ncbi:hypothetical protein QU38_00810, partial [Staphylococcus aureus]
MLAAKVKKSLTAGHATPARARGLRAPPPPVPPPRPPRRGAAAQAAGRQRRQALRIELHGLLRLLLHLHRLTARACRLRAARRARGA